MKQKINVGLIGLGTVGSGAFRILRDNAELIRHRVGVPVEVTKIAVRDATRDRGVAIPAGVLTTNPSQVIDDPNIDIVIELIGGYEPARELILAAIARGKHVVTANKALLAADGAEIHEAARRAGVSIGYEASVGGGIPVIKALKEALAANRILSIYGIINGTSNYILKLLAIAKMHEGGQAEARVHPTMVPDDYPIAKVAGVYNAIQIVGNACDDIMLYGRGAGSMPTGSAVVADVMDIARQILIAPSRKLPAGNATSDAALALQPMESIVSLYYFRFMALDQPGVLAQISGILGRHRISIAQMIQRGRKQGGSVPLVIMTHKALERDIQKALVEIKSLSCITEDPILIRVEGEEP